MIAGLVLVSLTCIPNVLLAYLGDLTHPSGVKLKQYCAYNTEGNKQLWRVVRIVNVVLQVRSVFKNIVKLCLTICDNLLKIVF